MMNWFAKLLKAENVLFSAHSNGVRGKSTNISYHKLCTFYNYSYKQKTLSERTKNSENF